MVDQILCRCDHSDDENGRCLNCGNPIFERSDVLLHELPLPPFSKEPRAIAADPPAWRVCPDCGVENTEHKRECPRLWRNIDRYVPPLVR